MVRICSDPYPTKSNYDERFDLYPYPLSDFQKYAIEAIVTGNHVLVTAHTGSGKTLPAEFALDYFVQQGKKVIYTSPIKALSNQKYSEFQRKYPHISFGLLTGDIKTNPDADVLIMTTEILMNALFLGDSKSNETKGLSFQLDIKNDLACVIFDEVHYINDADRGQTWEKTILMLPRHIQMVMLSATIDSPERFAAWCERDDLSKEVFLASSSKRIVPLTHYGYLTIPEGAFKTIKDKTMEKEIRESTHTLIPLQTEHGTFQDNGYRVLSKMSKLFDTRHIITKRKHVLNNLALFLRDREMLPAIAFVFSRKQVEACAHEMTVPMLEDDSKVGYTVRRECEQIVRKLPNFQEYLELPEYENLVRLLEKGIGIHHSGMIPILREIVEILISKRYIKLLFATESFAIGLDCPIKTAVFTGLTKFDGSNERILMSHEYTQMAGRAGRRGIDTIGHVVHCNNLFELPTATEYKAMLGGKPQELVSKFRISYPLILNLLQKSTCDMDTFLSFAKQSMVFNELQTMIQSHKQQIAQKMEQYDRVQYSITFLKTPLEICRRFIYLKDAIKTAVNKRRKEYDREIQTILSEYITCEKDAISVHNLDTVSNEILDDQEELAFLETYIETQIMCVCDVLKEKGFYQTPLGKMASGIAEIHPLIISHWIQQWNWFCDFSPVQMIGLMACFTDVKVWSEEKRGFPCSTDVFVKARIQEIADTYQEYEELESARHMRTGIQYQDALNFDMTDFAMDWCRCTNEMECKEFIQIRVAEKGISVGDFTKAMLKISTIVKEWSNIAESEGQIECLHKLSQIDGMILKYVTTSQSLYV